MLKCEAVLVTVLGFVALTTRAQRTVLVSFMPQEGRSCIARYVIGADGAWTEAGVWREKPATGLAAIGDGWVYTAGGTAIGRFRADGTPDNGPFAVNERTFWTFTPSPDNLAFWCAQFQNAPGSLATLEKRLISDPQAGTVPVDGQARPAVRLETARQLAFGTDGLLYVGCRGSVPGKPRSGVAALDVSGAAVREVAFYPMTGAMGGFVFDPDGRRLVVHGHGRGRIFEVGSPNVWKDIAKGPSNSFCAAKIGGEWHCGDYADGTVWKYASDGRFVPVTKLRPGLTAMLCLDDVGTPTPRKGDVSSASGALQGPYERLRYNSKGTCDLKVGLWAFPLPMDYDGDGIDDMVVHCPDTPWCGTFLFTGTPSGVFKAPVRLDSGRRWNVSSSLVNGEPVVMTPESTHWNFVRNGFEKNEFCDQTLSRTLKWRAGMWRFADLDGDGIADRVCFADGTAYWEKSLTPNGPAATYAPPRQLVDQVNRPLKGLDALCDLTDLDGDGDLDLLYPRHPDGFRWRENVGTKTAPRFAAARTLKSTTGTNLTVFLCMNVPCGWDLDHDGHVDILSGDEDGRILYFRNSGRRDTDGSPTFEPYRALRQQRADLTEGVLVAPSACDWDGDGDTDLICGDSAGCLTFIENLSGPGVERPSWAEPVRLSCEGVGGIPADHAENNPIRLVAGLTGSIQGPGEAKWGYTSPTVIDWDGDGLLDVVNNSVWGYVYWHRNVGTRTAPKLGPATPIEVEWAGAQPELAWGVNKPKGKELMTQWRTTPVTDDWDGDGLPDLIMLDPEGYLALYRRAVRDGRRVLLPPERVFIDEDTGAALRPNDKAAGQSGRRKICVMDWDGDGRKDFFISSSLYHQFVRGVSVDWWQQTKSADGRWHFVNRGRLSPSRLHGHSCAPTPVDFNGDGIPDIVIGAEDGCFYYLRNPRGK